MNKHDITTVFLAADHRGVGLKLYLYEMLSLTKNTVTEKLSFPEKQ